MNGGKNLSGKVTQVLLKETNKGDTKPIHHLGEQICKGSKRVTSSTRFVLFSVQWAMGWINAKPLEIRVELASTKPNYKQIWGLAGEKQNGGQNLPLHKSSSCAKPLVMYTHLKKWACGTACFFSSKLVIH